MKKNNIIISGIILIIVFMIAFCLSDIITELDGTVIDKGKEYPVEIVIKHRKCDIILKRLSGNVTITDGENIEKYDFMGKVISHPSGVNIITICGYIIDERDPDFKFGRMFFDDDMKNIILIFEEKNVYSAEENFTSKVEKIAK